MELRDNSPVRGADFDTAGPTRRFVRTMVATRMGSWCARHLLHHLDRTAFGITGARGFAGRYLDIDLDVVAVAV